MTKIHFNKINLFDAFGGDGTRHTKYLGVKRDDKYNQTHIDLSLKTIQKNTYNICFSYLFIYHTKEN